MTKIIWTRDDFIIEENEKVCGLSNPGEKKLSKTQTLVIPEGIKVIGKKAFDSRYLKKLVLPTSLVTIQEGAFLNCRIREVEGGENVEVLEKNAFSYNIISDVSNFKNVRCIKRAAFCGNKITNFKAPKTLKFIEGNTFSDNGILICDLRDTENLEIGENAFERNGMEELYLGKKAHIDTCSFYLNNIQKITGIESAKLKFKAFQEAIGKTYKKDFKVFPDKEWTKDDFEIEENKIIGITESGEMKAEISHHITIPHIEGVDTIGGNAFRETLAKTIYISDGYKTIGETAFYNSEIEYIRLPEDLKKIEREAFEYSKLKYVKVPKSVTSIADYTFCQTSLIKADLSECKIKVLRTAMFLSCSYLKEVLLPNTLTKINENTLEGTYALKTLEIPEKVQEIKEFAFTDSGIRAIHFKNNLKPMIIEERAFYNSKLTKIVGDDLMFERIGTAAFKDTFLEEFKAKCVNVISYNSFTFSPLNLVEIKDVSVINKEAFANNGIKKVKLGGVMEIAGDAFHLNLIEDLEFFDNSVVEEISIAAFARNNLTKVHLGEHVKRVSQLSFIANPLEEFEISEETEIEMLEF